MLLAVDIGNSNIVFGVYDKKKLCFYSRISTDKKLESSQYAVQIYEILKLNNIAAELINRAVISSVVPRLTKVLTDACVMLFGNCTEEFCAAHFPDLEIKIDNPQELGSDLCAGALFVKRNLPVPAVIIDIGTATKLSAIDKFGAFCGAAIAPGIFISLDALLSKTSMLMDIQVVAPKKAIGTNTQDAIKSGMLLGTAAMLDGMIERFTAELGTVKTIVGTGGGASFVFPLMKNKVLLRQTLVLDGILSAFYPEHKDIQDM